MRPSRASSIDTFAPIEGFDESACSGTAPVGTGPRKLRRFEDTSLSAVMRARARGGGTIQRERTRARLTAVVPENEELATGTV